MQKGRRWWFLGETESLQQLRVWVCPPGTEKRGRWQDQSRSSGLGDAEKLGGSLWTQALGVDVCFRNGREDRQVGAGGNRVGWRERQKGY